MKKLGLNELFGALIAGIITAMCFTPSKPVTPPPEECYTPQCLYEKCIALGYPEQSCRQMYLPETIILPPAPPPEYPPVVIPAVTYVLTIQAGPGGSTVPVPGTYQPIAHDAIISITAVPNSGYVFDHWTVNGEVRSENPIGWEESTEDITLIAYFTPVAAPPAPPPAVEAAPPEYKEMAAAVTYAEEHPLEQAAYAAPPTPEYQYVVAWMQAYWWPRGAVGIFTIADYEEKRRSGNYSYMILAYAKTYDAAYKIYREVAAYY